MSLPQEIKYLIREFLYPTLQQVMKKHQEEVSEAFTGNYANHCYMCGEALPDYIEFLDYTLPRICSCGNDQYQSRDRYEW